MTSSAYHVEDSLSPVLEEVLDDCLKLLLLRGYEEASLEELAVAGGTYKGFILSHFTTKKQFCMAAVKWHFSKNMRQLGAILAIHSEIYSAVEALLYEYIELVTEQCRAGKGILFHSLLDICRLDADLIMTLAEIKRDATERFMLKFIQCEVDLKVPAEAAGLAAFYITVVEGLAVQARAGMSSNSLYQTADFSLVVLGRRLKTPVL
ncbi:hypothetical protein [Pseudovibrio sp. Tun.PSC04-5.I4]|uniref:TetR/AcrR family transcriptional regulator n=1 Tax=Pseudovibrio sp. Tun.PSC04-5.I4 TaxID=1798213 RepID=UPI00088CC937|nr:hypothetical protein [Pseudovibrio sp. Tun.PSC04-5.I4]SDQ95768.1 DNA-binding transcriptional regulator, AcrR family [Pseudovibrio sp. Tun.PSC04-5.I4]